MSKLLAPFPNWLRERDIIQRFSDFNEYVTLHGFTTVVSNSGTVVAGDAVGGRVTLNPSDCSVVDNDEAYLKGANEIFKFANHKPLIFEALVQFTEGNTDDANVIVGLKDAVAADSILDNGAGPAASYSGAVFFKVDGDTIWNVETSIGGTQTTTRLSAANSLDKQDKTAGGAAFQRLRIEFEPFSSTQANVMFSIDGALVAKHIFTYTSATEMQECFGIKNGANTTVEALVVDYSYCAQAR